MATRRSLIPSLDGATEDVVERLAHRDLAHMSAEQAWGESTLLTAWLATAIFDDTRARYLDPSLDLTDHAWVRERLRRLRAVATGRKVDA